MTTDNKITIERETLEQAITALTYHQSQTRPIERTRITLDILRASLAAQPATMDDHLECGHHRSLAINSAETGEFLYCDLCDTKSRCRDAEAMEADLRAALAAQPAPAAAQPVEPFQSRVQPWMMACFGATISRDKAERNHRFLEEALELVQACGCMESEAAQLVAYVYGRPAGDPPQEVGGVMVTLAALCLAQGMDMHAAGEVELARIWTKVEKIRAKQAAKPKHSPLPQIAPPAHAAVPPGYVLVPDYRGYANLGTGQYLLNISGADEPPELIISIASDEEKAGRTVGDLRDNQPGTVIQPEQMAVRLRFASEAGLAALEQQLRILREERFAAAAGDKPGA